LKVQGIEEKLHKKLADTFLLHPVHQPCHVTRRLVITWVHRAVNHQLTQCAQITSLHNFHEALIRITLIQRSIVSLMLNEKNGKCQTPSNRRTNERTGGQSDASLLPSVRSSVYGVWH